MYWPGAAQPWGEGHNSFGVVDAGTKWGLAEGRTGGPLKFHTYILLANPQTTDANVTVTFLRESGAPVTQTYTVPKTSRFNIDIERHRGPGGGVVRRADRGDERRADHRRAIDVLGFERHPVLRRHQRHRHPLAVVIYCPAQCKIPARFWWCAPIGRRSAGDR